MSTLQEIKAAVAQLEPAEQALLAADLFARQGEPDEMRLESSLQRGLADVEEGRVRPLQEVKKMIPAWVSRS